jgi:eukaryotic-like serine/threonine-protein kinase
MSSCPGDGALRMLGTDAIGDATYAAIEHHVEGCPDCKSDLERLAHRHLAPAVVSADPERLPCIPGFEIQSELGRGAMGVVYLAIETGLDRLVALKVLPGSMGADGGAGPRRRWLREARAISSVRHPNVVPLYDFGEADGSFFLVLEFVPGGTLKQRLTEPLPPRVAAGLIETTARAVGHVHNRGLFHLDLKPSNILLDGEENEPWERVTPRIADFGLAISNDDAGASENSLAGIRGTPSYMAPEQASGTRANVGAAVDIHALGAILYELLTGRPPFRGTSTLETLDQIRGQNPVPLRRLNPKLPRDLETIALKCLEKNPLRRYASAATLADDLHRWLDSRPILARPVSPFEHGARWCRRQPIIAALATTLMLTLIGGILGLLALLRRSETLRSSSDERYQVASQALDGLTNIFVEDAQLNKKTPVYYRRDQRWKAIEIARLQVLELLKQDPRDIRSLRRLASIDHRLTTFCSVNGKETEARSLIEEAIGCLETCLAVAPGDMEIRLQLLTEIDLLLPHLFGRANDRLYDRWNARAIAMLEQLKASHEDHIRVALALSRVHRDRANTLISNGELDFARTALVTDVRWVRSLLDADSECPVFILSEALTLAALGQWSGEFKLARTSIQLHQSDVEIRNLELGLAELTARRVGWLPTSVKSPLLLPADLPDGAWADRVISAIESDAAKFRIARTRIPAIAWSTRGYFTDTLWRQRTVGKLDDAQRIVDQLLALAERLTKSYPDQAAPCMLLSEGYVQRAKNAFRIPGEPVKEWNQNALDAAIQAAALDPENEEAHNLVKERRARVNRPALR